MKMTVPSDRVRKLIDKKRESLKDADSLLSAYSVDRAKTEEYNGRQLLELIQNAVDATAHNVLLRLVSVNGEEWLEVWDDGGAFLFEGIRSLMYPGRSPKTSGTYIGNKGLGFRSLLNWADTIVIETEDGPVEFSRELAESFWNESFDSNQQVSILQMGGYSKEVIPVPVLGVPDYPASAYEVKDRPWDKGKVIRVKFIPRFKEDILKQMDELDDRTLLFLVSLNTIEVDKGDGKPVKHTRGKTVDSGDCKVVTIDGYDWEVYSKSGLLPGEYKDSSRTGEQRYSVAVALCRSNLDKNHPGPLYNYFKTSVHVPLPCTIHATVELNDSRDHLKPNYKSNDFIVKVIQELLVECAGKRLCENKDPWIQFRILTPVGGDAVPCLGMNEFLKGRRQELPILPTLSGDTVKWTEAFVLDNEFSSFCKEKGFAVSRLLLPFRDDWAYAVPTKKYELEAFVDSVNQSVRCQAPELMAEFIWQIWKAFPHATDCSKKASLLLNANKEAIDGKKAAYTPPSADGSTIEIPDSIDIVDSEQYECLKRLFSERINGQNQARALRDEVSFFLNIRDYDITSINEAIIGETSRIVQEPADSEEKIGHIKTMVRKLFHNYDISHEKKVDMGARCRGTVWLINDDGNPCQSNDLLFKPTGEEDSYSSKDYLMRFDDWELPAAENSDTDVKSFFWWLGVNDSVKVELKEGKSGDLVYPPFLTKDNLGGYNPSRIKAYSFFAIKEFPPAVNPEKFVKLLAGSPAVQDALTAGKNDKVTIYYYADKTTDIHPAESYIHMQLRTWNPDNNPFEGRLVSEVFKGKRDLDPTWIPVLKALGAHEDFDEMDSAELYAYLDRIGKDSKPVGIQQTYVQVLESLSRLGATPAPDQDFKLFVRDRNHALSRSDVYYSDNNVIPRFLRDNFPIVALPSRRGVEKVCNCFGIRRLSESVQVRNPEEKKDADDFKRHLESLHPFLLAFRLFSEPIVSEKSGQDAEAGKLRNARIRLVRRLTYSIGNSADEMELEDYEYIHSNNTYYLKVPEQLGWQSLLRNSSFSDAVADIYAGVFDVKHLTDQFRSILRNDDSSDLWHQLIVKFGTDHVEKLNDLLGVNAKKFFWERFAGLETCVPAGEDVDYKDLSQPAGIRLLGELADKGRKEDVFKYFGSDIRRWCDRELPRVIERYRKSFAYERWSYLQDKQQECKRRYVKDLASYGGLGYTNLFPNKDDIVFNEEGLVVALKVYCFKEWIVELKEDSPKTVDVCEEYRSIIDGPESLDVENRGLLYFAGYSEEIKSLVEQGQEKAEKEIDALNDAPCEEISFVSKMDEAKWDYNPTQGKNNAFRHNSRQDRINKQKGDLAENKVLQKLKDMGFEADKISGGSWAADSGEMYHADIKYRRKGDPNYRYLEVKYSTSNSFHLSAAEWRTATDEKYRDIYDLAIFDGKKPVIIKKLHHYLDSKRMVFNPSEYIVCFGNISTVDEDNP